MNTLEAILTRQSVREYTEQKITDEELHNILEAGMSGPSAVNARPWTFIVVRDKETLSHMADINGRPARLLRGADLGILVCGDLHRAFRLAPEFWVIDCSIAAQNMALAAHAMGIGCVWLGTWPVMDRVEKQQKFFGLPEHIVPHSILSFGFPAKESAPPKDHWEEDRVHWEKW